MIRDIVHMNFIQKHSLPSIKAKYIYLLKVQETKAGHQNFIQTCHTIDKKCALKVEPPFCNPRHKSYEILNKILECNEAGYALKTDHDLEAWFLELAKTKGINQRFLVEKYRLDVPKMEYYHYLNHHYERKRLSIEDFHNVALETKHNETGLTESHHKTLLTYPFLREHLEKAVLRKKPMFLVA